MVAHTSGATPDVAPVREGENLDWARLEAHLRSELPELEGDFSVLQFPKGSANLTYQVTIGETRLVVRRPPFGSIAKGAHDMGREYRVLSRLGLAYPRAPRALLHCGDPEVIGAEFLVSEYREGVVVWDRVPESMSGVADAERRIGFAVVDALADLHRVVPDEVGLGDLGRPEGYLERQVSGWRGRWAGVSAQADTPELDALVSGIGATLQERLPKPQRSGIVHNDFKIDNCQFSQGDPDTVTSVFDWDMATTGDVLCDLGTLLNYWPDRTLEAGSDEAFVAVRSTAELDLPSRLEVIERYSAGTDLDLADISWYEAFGCWKTVVILQQLYARFVRGETSDPRMGQRGILIPPLARRAAALLA